jgi:hypothetical protein
MRAAAILGPGDVSNTVARFQREAGVRWTSLIEQADAIAIFGGDGTIHRHLSTLVDLNVPVLVVPCGSGNDFARALGLRKIILPSPVNIPGTGGTRVGAILRHSSPVSVSLTGQILVWT